MLYKSLHRSALFALAVMGLQLIVSASSASQVVTVNLDLTDPGAANPGDPNAFFTDFDFSVVSLLGTTSGGITNVGVTYEDEPNKTGLRVELDIDFANPTSPVVKTIKFVGEEEDIDHFLVTPGPIMFSQNGIDATITPNGVGSFVRTDGPAVQVDGSGMFDSGPNTSLNVVEGTIAVQAVESNITLFSEVFDLGANGLSSSSLAGGALSEVLVTFDKTENGFDFYNVQVTTPLEDAMSDFQLDLGLGTIADLTLTISGDFVGTGSFSVRSAVPEPASLALLVIAGGLGLVRRR